MSGSAYITPAAVPVADSPVWSVVAMPVLLIEFVLPDFAVSHDTLVVSAVFESLSSFPAYPDVPMAIRTPLVGAECFLHGLTLSPITALFLATGIIRFMHSRHKLGITPQAVGFLG
jgi:hypothetical protein